jgi:hypothetical protein
MDIQRNLAVLRQYYAALSTNNLWKGATGTTFEYMKMVTSTPVFNESSVDAKALVNLLVILQENGFSDLYLNGRRIIGTKYGTVPLEIEVVPTMGVAGAVWGFRIGLYLRYTKRFSGMDESARLCGRWHWDADCGLIADVPLDMARVIWGVKGAPR